MLKAAVYDVKRRLLNLLIAVDQFLFVVITLGHAAPDETPSAAAYRLEYEGHWAGRLFRPSIDWLFRVFFGQSNHCLRAARAEQARLQAKDYSFLPAED